MLRVVIGLSVAVGALVVLSGVIAHFALGMSWPISMRDAAVGVPASIFLGWVIYDRIPTLLRRMKVL
jgi:hypothetical protein